MNCDLAGMCELRVSQLRTAISMKVFITNKKQSKFVLFRPPGRSWNHTALVHNHLAKGWCQQQVFEAQKSVNKNQVNLIYGDYWDLIIQGLLKKTFLNNILHTKIWVFLNDLPIYLHYVNCIRTKQDAVSVRTHE